MSEEYEEANDQCDEQIIEIRALKAKLAATEVRLEAALAALHAVNRMLPGYTPCWCGHRRDPDRDGHSDDCKQGTAALAMTTEQAASVIEDNKRLRSILEAVQHIVDIASIVMLVDGQDQERLAIENRAQVRLARRIKLVLAPPKGEME